MTDYSNLKILADAAPMAMTMTNGGEEHKALIAFTDEVKRLFGNDVGMARVLIAENEALCANASLLDLLPELDEALEDLEIHGQHSDQGYRKLKDWYRKIDLACKAVDAAMSKEGRDERGI